MKVEYINPFVMAAVNILEQVAQLKVERGKVSLRPRICPQPDVSVIIGVTGDVRGQVIIGLSEETALAVAKRMMMGLELDNFDDVGRSAISELGNMIAGNATGALERDGLEASISPPALVTGHDISVSSPEAPILMVPLSSEVGSLEINVCLAEHKGKK